MASLQYLCRFGVLFSTIIGVVVIIWNNNQVTPLVASVNVNNTQNLISTVEVKEENVLFTPEEKEIHNWTNPTRIFYNRVPKCGSTTTSAILKALGKKNQYRYHFSINYPKDYYVDGERTVTSWYFKLTPPVMAIEHVHFLNFSKYPPFSTNEEPPPTYINLIRDPLERLQSFYYFIRYQPGHKREMSLERRNMTYDECVSRKDPECVSSHHYFTQLPFFCGLNPECRQPGQYALSQAKTNVLKHFAVVGYTEDIRNFFLALEWMFPRWFTGAIDQYDGSVLSKAAVKMKSLKSPSRQLSSENHELMQSLLKEEYDFYHFVRQRFALYMEKMQKEVPVEMLDQNLNLEKLKKRQLTVAHNSTKKGQTN